MARCGTTAHSIGAGPPLSFFKQTMSTATARLGSPVFSRLSSGLLWNGSANLASQGGMFITALIAANILGVSQFGEFSLVLLTLLAVVSVAVGAVSTTATRYVAELRATDKARAGRVLSLCYLSSLALGVGGCLVVLFARDWIVATVLDSPRLGSSLALGSAFVLWSVISTFQAGALSGLEGFKSLAIIQSICAFLQIVLCWLLATAMGLAGLIIGLVLVGVCRCALLGLQLHTLCRYQEIRWDFRNAWAELRIVRRFAAPSLLIGIVGNISQWLVHALLARESGIVELGLFGAANNLRSLVLFVPLVFQPVVLTFLSTQHGSASSQQAAKVYWSNIGFVMCVTGLLGVAMVVLAPLILGLYGPGFSDARATLQILMIAAILEAAYYAAYQLLLTRQSMWFSLVAINSPWALSLVVAAYVLVPIGGAQSLATAYAIAWSIALAVVVGCVARRGVA